MQQHLIREDLPEGEIVHVVVDRATGQQAWLVSAAHTTDEYVDAVNALLAELAAKVEAA